MGDKLIRMEPQERGEQQLWQRRRQKQEGEDQGAPRLQKQTAASANAVTRLRRLTRVPPAAATECARDVRRRWPQEASARSAQSSTYPSPPSPTDSWRGSDFVYVCVCVLL